MRRPVSCMLVSFLLVTLTFFQQGIVPTTKASSLLHQGDLILTGNNVTIIEDRFDINGSIIVEENATLILRNAILNFTQARGYQFNMTFRNPSNGNPRLLVENTTITANNYNIYVHFYGNSSASINKLEASKVALNTYEFSTASIEYSTMYRMGIGGNSNLNLSNSVLPFDLGTYDDSNVNVFNCTLGSLHAEGGYSVNVSSSIFNYHVAPRTYSANFSITGLEPGFFNYWNFRLNCSLAVAPDGKASNIALTDTQVNGWIFYLRQFSNATITNSALKDISSYDFAVVSIYDSSLTSTVTNFDISRTYIYNSTADGVYSYEDSRIWLTNSTINNYKIYDQSEIYVSWYLYIHVVDSISQDVPLANVTATYPNATVAESKLTGENGWTRLKLVEKMMNTSGEYPIKNYTVEAKYEAYLSSTMVNMTGNKEIILLLEGLVVPEFTSSLILPVFVVATLLAVIVYRRKQSLQKLNLKILT